MHQFPLNGLIALFTLGMWAIVWLGFGWVQRLEWLFTGRRRRARGARIELEDDVARARRVPLVVVVVALLVAAGLATTLTHPRIPRSCPVDSRSRATPSRPRSTAPVSRAAGTAAGRITFYNTASAPRT